MRTPLQQARFRAAGARPVTWRGLHGASAALALHAAARGHRGLTLVLTRSSHRAQVLEHDLRLLADGALPVWHFPDRETLPYDPFSTHPDIVSERLAALAAVARLERGILVAPAPGVLQRLPPRSHVLGRALDLEVGQRLTIEAFRGQLLHAGYTASDQVWQAGQFAVRGSVVDLFPTGLKQPIRIDLFDQDIESIRSFDAETQRSEDSLERLRMLPAREYPADEAALEAFRRAFRYRFAVDTRKVPLYQDLQSGAHPQGLDQYLPLFFETTESLLDYLPGECAVVLEDGVEDALAAFEAQCAERYEQRRHDLERPVLEPAELFFTPAELLAACAPSLRARLGGEAAAGDAAVEFDVAEAPTFGMHERDAEPGARLLAFHADWPGRVLFAADSAGRREVLAESLAALGLRPQRHDDWRGFLAGDARLGLCVLPVEDGFLAGESLAVLTEAQLFGGRARKPVERRVTERDPDAIIRNLGELEPGAPVVHEDHGVGRYQGLQVLDIDGRPAEFLTLEYANEDRLYVPVSALHLVSRYTGSAPENAPLHRLGGDAWEKAKRRAAEKVRDVAAELLDLYARRQARQGHAFDVDARLWAEFSSGFPYEETPDQLAAIEAVRADMESAAPMDRVVCGDVGFGKTEVALRAAFIAVQGGRQVALLAPTTLLAQQHFNTFSDRFADWPVRIELLSRFRAGKQADTALENLASGRSDIVIGTHRLLQRDIRFDRLGLVIVDEEQRFGVQQKERLKQLRAEVDLLTLTATPIPRTLNMALSGIRELSIIATPPARRMAVKTLVVEWDAALLREALARELQRGGQVYVLHNEVRTIEKMAREIRELAPGARVEVAHGQMRERELERVMLDFYRQRFNVLVCSTIIENGIDVPSANTIVINRADRFGLAQLHQLRGRVGRSHHLAYAYLITPDRRSLSRDAEKRLEAIASLEELGAGFTLATHDMEIRGAGELLGEEQSGQIHQVGFSLYSELLARAVAALRAGVEPELDQPLHRGCEVELHVPALIPEDYLFDVHTRLTLYKRIAGAASEDGLRDLQVEMIDRFGLLPGAVKNLFRIAGLRLAANALGITRLDFGPRGGRVEFAADTRASVDALLSLVREHPLDYRLAGPQRLSITRHEEDGDRRLEQAAGLLQRLRGSGEAI